MRPLLVVALDEGVEAGLLLQHVGRGWLGGFLLQGEMHPLVAAVLLRLPGVDALDLNPQPEPPDRELAEPVDRMRRREGHAIVGPDDLREPNSWNVRSKTVKANRSWVVASASQVRR